jgi:hypothetical protein
MSSIERQRKAGMRTLIRRHGMLPEKAEELSRQVAGLDDWRVHCHNCDATIVGTQAMIREHGETCRGPAAC